MFGLFKRQDPRFQDDGNFLLCQVRTKPHGEIIKVRLSKTSEMSMNRSGYFVRKSLIGPKSLDRAELEVNMNRNHKVISADVSGGELLEIGQWE